LNSKHWHVYALIGIVILQLIVVFYFAFQKQGYFIDEIFSYSRATSYYNKNYLLEFSLYDKWNETEQLARLVVVQEEHRFAYGSVYIYQAIGVHPPLYYFILHTICSFFPENFSKWYGLSINIVLFLVCNLFLYLLSKELFKDRLLALLPCIIWGFSLGAINTVTFIRMYMLLTTVTVIFVYYHFLLKKNQISQKNRLILFIIILMGFMTHYYFLVFIFIWAALFSIYWMFQKEWTKLFRYLSVYLYAICVGLIIFIHAINHIFLGMRGKPALESLTRVSDFIINLEKMVQLMSREQFGGFFPGLILILASLIIIKRMQNSKNYLPFQINKFNFNSIIGVYVDNITLVSLMISVIATFIVISKVSPYMDTRYLFYLYPMITLLIIFYVYKVCSLIIKNKVNLFGGILLIFTVLTVSSHKIGNLQYIYPNAGEILLTAQEYKEYDIIYITDREWIICSNLFELLEFQRIYVTGVAAVPDLPEVIGDQLNEGSFILYIDKAENQEKILEMLLSSYLGRIVPLYQTDFSVTYLIE
jgi:hypothetical protein